MRKLTGLAAAMLAMAAFAQDGEHNVIDIVVINEKVRENVSAAWQEFEGRAMQVIEARNAANTELEARIAELEAQLAAAPAATPAPAAAAFPRIRHNGDVSMTPRMEISTRNDDGGAKIEDHEFKNAKGEKVGFNANHRRMMMAWNYRFNVAVNEKLDVGFRLADPSGGVGSSVSAARIAPTLPNAWFNWKAADAFHLSGGLINVSSSTTLDLATLAISKNPINTFAVEFHNSLAGFDFSFPVSPAARIYLMAGFHSNASGNIVPFIAGKDTLRSYNDGRIIVGTDLTLADKKVSIRPSIQVLTRGDLPSGTSDTPEASINSDRKPLVAEGIDMGFKITDEFSLNASVGAAHDFLNDSTKNLLVSLGAEPVLVFGGESGRLFNFRVRYSFHTYGNTEEDDKDVENAILHFVDARFGVAVNPRFSIVPRYRMWASNNQHSWLETTTKDDKSKRAMHRLELGFNAAF